MHIVEQVTPARITSGRRRGAGLDPYLVVAVPVVGWAVLLTLRHHWTGDILLHVASVQGMLHGGRDPMVGAVHGSPYYSPYVAVLALVSWSTGLAPATVLVWAGPVNVAALLWALRRFCRHLGPHRLTPVLALVFLLWLWGTEPVTWSGFLGFSSLAWITPYPSTFAAALMLLAWDAYARVVKGGRWAPLVGWLTLVVLVHPFTAAETVIGLLAFTLADPRAVSGRRALGFAVAGLTALVAVVVWPYSDFTSLFTASGELNGVHRMLAEDLWRDGVLAHYGLALIALPALVVAGRRPYGRRLQVCFALLAVVVAGGIAVGQYNVSRFIPVGLLVLDLALADCLADAFSRRRSPPWAVCYAVPVVAACVVGFQGAEAGLDRAAPPWRLRAGHGGEWRDPYRRATTLLHPGQVVMTPGRGTSRLVNGRGAYSVVPGWPYPFVDEAARRADAARFYAPGTAVSERLAIAARYRLACFLAPTTHPIRLPGFVPLGTGAGLTLSCRPGR
jgi:alpha-1,6-mannosyltransferase